MVDVQFPTWPPLITERQGRCLSLLRDRMRVFTAKQVVTDISLAGRVGMHCYCSLYGSYWCHRECSVKIPESLWGLFCITSGEYGVLLLGRGKNIGILPPPWSLLKLVEDKWKSLVISWWTGTVSHSGCRLTGIRLWKAWGASLQTGMVSMLPAWPLLAWVRIRTFFFSCVVCWG